MRGAATAAASDLERLANSGANTMAPALIAAQVRLEMRLPSRPVSTLRLLCNRRGRRRPCSALFVQFHVSGLTTDGCPVTNGHDQILLIAKLSEHISCVFQISVNYQRRFCVGITWAAAAAAGWMTVPWGEKFGFPTHNWPEPILPFSSPEPPRPVRVMHMQEAVMYALLSWG